MSTLQATRTYSYTKQSFAKYVHSFLRLMLARGVRFVVCLVGFACPPAFCLQAGTEGKTGLLLVEALKYIADKKPDAFCIENVPGIKQQKHKHFLEWFISCLENIKEEDCSPAQKTIAFRYL